jgi:hypothetical protein
MTGFQKFVNQQPAPAVAGDFYGANPRMSVPGGAFDYKPDTGGLLVGRFAWFNPDTHIAANAAANGGLLAFVHRENQALLTTFLQEAGLTIPEGYPAYGMSRGEFWADFPAGADVGQPVYANDTTGAAQVDPTGATLTPFVVASPAFAPAVTDTATTIAALTGVMTVAAMASGEIQVGDVLTWSGQPANLHVLVTAQLTGTAGLDGTYQTTFTERPAVTARAVTASQGTLAKISSWIQPTA